MFTASYVILHAMVRLGQTKLAGTSFGAALAWLQ